MINKHFLKKIILSIITVLLVFTSSTLAATIITGEKSEANDEWDQQMTVDEVSEEGTKWAEKVTTQTEEEQEAEKQQAYDTKTKIEAELERQLKEDWASSVKYQIEYVIYFSETDVEDNIETIWKDVGGTQINTQHLQNIMNVVKNTLTTYGNSKIDLWFQQYYTNNKDIIVEKIEEYIDGDESYIESGISIVLFTAVTPLEDEVEKIAQEIMDGIPGKVKEVINAQKKFSTWESKAVNTICSELTISIQNEWEAAFSKAFDWQEPQLYEGFRNIGSFSSDVADQITESVKNNLADQICEALGYNSSLDFEELLLQFALNQLDGTMGEQFRLLNNVVQTNALTPTQILQYKKDYDNILARKEAIAKNEQTKKLNEANKQQVESERKRLEGEANDWYQNRLKEIEKEADAEAREKLKDAVYDEYKNKMNEIDEQIKNEAADLLNKETNALVNGILRENNIQMKDMDYAAIVINGKESELGKQEDDELKKNRIEYGLELSDEEKAIKNKEMIDEKTRHDNKDNAIDQKWGQELTDSEKESKNLEKTIEDGKNEQNRENLDRAYGQKLTVEQETAKENEIKAANEKAEADLKSLGAEYAEYKEQVKELKQEIENGKKAAEDEEDQKIKAVKEKYGQADLTEEKKVEKEILEEIIDQMKKDLDNEIDIKYGRKLSKQQEEAKEIRSEANEELHTLNMKQIQIEAGLALSDELTLEMNNKIQEIQKNYDNQIAPYLKAYEGNLTQAQMNANIDAHRELTLQKNAQIEAVRNDPKYKIKDLDELTPEEKTKYNTNMTSENNRYKNEENAIKEDFKLNKMDVIDGVTYNEAKNQLDDEMDMLEEKTMEPYKKRQLSGVDKDGNGVDDKIDYEAEIQKVENEREKADEEVDKKRKELDDLEDKNSDFKDREEQIEDELETKMDNIEEKYKPSGFPGATEEERKQNEELYNELVKSEEERHEAEIKRIEEKYGKRKLSEKEKAEYLAEKNAEDDKYKANREKIEEKYKTIDEDELDPAKKAEYEAKEKAIKEKYDQIRKEEEDRIKREKEIYKNKLQNAEEICEAGLGELTGRYQSEMAQLESDYKSGKISEEEYKNGKKKLKKAFEEGQTLLLAQKQKIIDEERTLWAQEKQLAHVATTMIVQQLSENLANELFTSLNLSIYEWSEDLGAVGAGIVQGVTNQITNWAKGELVRNINILWQQAWGNTASSLGINGFKLDWGQLALQVVFSWAMNNEFLADVLSGMGGFIPPKIPILYESLAVMNYGFISRPFITLVPTGMMTTATKLADKYAQQSKSIGDEGTFGTSESMGYNPLQFTPMGSTSLVALIPPYLYNDSVGMMPRLKPIMYGSWFPHPIPTWFMSNIAGPEAIPSYPVLSFPWIGPYFDSAYIASEFTSSFGNDSYVQRAFSYSSIALQAAATSKTTDSSIGGSLDAAGQLAFKQSKYSTALTKEALKYSEFALKVTLALGYPNSLKDLTNESALKTRYLHEQNLVLVGPFKVDYIKSGVQTEFRTTNFGMMVDMNVYYRDEATQQEKKISKDTWSIMFEENGEINFEFSEDRQGSEYIYPYPKEEFYIAIKKSENPNVTNISKIRMDFKELQTSMAGHYFDIAYDMIWNMSVMWPETLTAGVGWWKAIKSSKIAMIYEDNALFSVMYAKRFYMNWHMEISIAEKEQKTPAYDTADYFTTQYQTVATVGGGQADRDAIVYGDETNSALYNSVSSLLQNYNTGNKEKYNSSGSTFVQSVTNATQIYTSAYGDTAYSNAINAILNATAENDATKVLTTFEKITTEDNDDFQKIAIMVQELSKKEKVRELATIMETAVEIYKNTNDNVGREILNLLNETVILYNNEDYDAIMDSLNTIINNCDYKEEVFALLAQKTEFNLTNETMEYYLKTHYPMLNEDTRALIMATAKSMDSVLSNTGDKGNIIVQIIEKAYKVHEGKEVISELMAVIVNNSNNEELQKEYRSIVTIMQINNEIIIINANEALTDEEKYKYAQEEQVKMYKAISVAARAINAGEDVIDSIERAYGETSNIEKNVFTKFQNVVKDLEKDDVTKLTQSLIKSTDIETTLDIVNTEYLRNNLKGDTEKAQTFVEILEERAAIYDTTPYTQYDNNYNILARDEYTDVYYMDNRPTGMTITIGGVVWKDGHAGLENDFDGVRKANTNGALEKGIEGVQVTLIDERTNQVGKMMVDGKWQPAITYTDEGGYYHFEKVDLSQYYVQFTYDGHKYMATTSLSDGEKRTSVDDYTYIPDLELYDNNSKAAENPAERQAFNNKFYEIREGTAFSKDGKMTAIEYVEKDGVSELITLDNSGHVLPEFAMTASTKQLVGAKYGVAEYGLTYPIDTNVTLDNEKTEALLSQYLDANPQYGEYEKTGEYMYHVNLGLVERSKIDLATTQDVYEVTTTVNEKQETYTYNKRGILSVFDAKLKQTEAYSEIAYTRELYNADYQLRLEDYQANSLNKLDRNGNDKTAEIDKIKEIKDLQYSKGGLEQRVFVTYKITLKNQSMLQNARINEITDYFDPSYKLVTEDTYQEIQNAEGIVENKLVAKQSYFIVQSDNNATEYKLTWEETGMINGMKSMYTVQSDATGLEDIMLSAKDEIYVFVTFELDKTSMDTTNRTLPLGKKQNIVEISSYSTFEIGSEDWSNSIGLIDKDSAPDNLSVGEINSYEDDTDAAPIIDFKLYSTDLRNVNGYVWNDDRDVKLSTGQVVGNGVREEKEELINGVRVQLVEIVRDPRTGAEYEYVWKEMFTGEDNYKHIGSSGSITNTERGQTVSTGSIVSNTNLGAVQKGEYKFHNYIAGNFIIRFIYGDTYKTYLTAGSENAEGQGLNEASFNGHDYKSTAYLKGNNLYAEWYDLSGFDKEDKLYSDAKDDTTRRNVVIDYAATLQNDKAEILASFDDRAEKYYYDRQLHQTFRENTWMFADTAKINVNVEYNTTKSNGLDALNYKLKNMDFGIEKRPETKLELTKEITDIKITLASGEVIVNTAAGMSQNVNWPRNQKTAIINNGKKSTYNKRDSLRYEYRQGNAHIYMDEEVMQGTNIQFTYKITITNNSEIDYTGQNGNLGYAYYTGQVSASDRIVTTTVNKIIDYVDNSLTFRKVDSPEWDLIENMREFTTTSSGAQIEKEVMDYGTYIETMMQRYGEDYVADHLREFEAQYQIYTQTGSLEDIGNKKPNTEEENEKGVGLSNYNVLKNMKDRTNSIGYLNEDLAIVKTKSAKVSQEPITQVIVTKALENAALKPGESASVQLILSKTLSPNDEDDTLNYGNMAEILQYSNSVGRRDMDAIPGNQQPDEDPYEYDTDFTERILITPPYGENKAIYFVLSIAVLAILTGGIILIKKKVFNN